MKVAYIVDGRMPTEKANGYQSSQMCQAFVEAGCNLTMLSSSRKIIFVEGITKDTTIEDYYRLRIKIKQKKLLSIDFIYLLQVFLSISSKNPISKTGSLFSSWSAAISLAAHLHLTRYDLIYIRSLHVLLALLPLIPKSMYSRICFEIHMLPERQQSIVKLINTFQKIGGIVTVTDQLKQKLVERNVPLKKICVAHDGVDLETFDIDVTKAGARTHLNINQDRKIAAFIGKFHTNGNEKGIPEIIRSAKYLLEDIPDLDFYFVGGPLDRVASYERIIAEEGLPRERFIFLEKQPIHEVPYHLKASDVLLMPHPWSEFYAYYMSPLKLFEYMSARRPIIASSLPSIMEVLRDRENSLLGVPGDPESIAKNIRLALENKELANRIAIQAYADVQEYTWEKRAERILKFVAERQKDNDGPASFGTK